MLPFFSLPIRRAARVGLWAAVVLGVLVGGRPRAGHAQAMTQADTVRISFDEAVRTALDQNTDIKRAQASARQANIEVQSEWMDFAPDLNLSLRADRSFGRTFNDIVGGVITRSENSVGGSASSSITLFNGFENIASLNEAQNQAKADETSLKRKRREVVFTVIDRYISLIESREIIRVRKEELEARRQQLRQIEEFVDAGSRPVSDLYQEQANVAEAEQRLLQAEREREVNMTRLIQTLQLNPRKPYRFETPALAADTLDVETYDLSALMDAAFENRLDLRAAEAERSAAEKGVRAARSSYYPTLSLDANYRTDWSDQRVRAGETPGFTEQLADNRNGSFGLSLRIPIFDRFRRKTQVEQAQVQAQNAKYRLQDQRQQIALQVRQAYLDYRNAVQQLEAANKRLRAARQARASARERYNLGSASIVELQNARRDFVDAASQQVRARYNLIFQKKKIDYHTGRLDPDEPLIRQEDAQ